MSNETAKKPERFGVYRGEHEGLPKTILAASQADADAFFGSEAPWVRPVASDGIATSLLYGKVTRKAAAFIADRFQSGLDADGYWICESCGLLHGPEDMDCGSDCNLCGPCAARIQEEEKTHD